MNVIIVVDLGAGDAGKGSIVDYLTCVHHPHTIVRFNGGAQAAHNVVMSDGTHHTFSQFGSGMLSSDKVSTHLSRFMLVDPSAMLNEERSLRLLGARDVLKRVTIEESALVVTPYHRAANQLRELLRGDNRHGSCGMGIGEAVADKLAGTLDTIYVRDLLHLDLITGKLESIRKRKWEEFKWLIGHLPTELITNAVRVLSDVSRSQVIASNYSDLVKQVKIVESSYLDLLLEQRGVVIFEGAQGVLLDENYGFHPHTTWSDTTFNNAETLLLGHELEVTRLGVLRTYSTRHGPGPFVTETNDLSHPEVHNCFNLWQRDFRVGYPDIVMLRYAVDVVKNNLDGLAITHLDRQPSKICEKYRYQDELIDLLEVKRPTDLSYQSTLAKLLPEYRPRYTEVEDVSDYISSTLGIPILIESFGPTALDKRYTSRKE